MQERPRALRRAWIDALGRSSRLLPAIGCIASVLCVARPAAAAVIVNTTSDEFGAGGACSLREAIQAINAEANFGGCGWDGGTTVDVPEGVYTLTLGGAPEDVNATGDLDLTAPSITLIGQGTVQIDGTDIGRVLHVHAGSVAVIDNVDITNGQLAVAKYAAQLRGAGIFNEGSLSLYDSQVTGNTSSGVGFNAAGGIASTGTLLVSDSVITSNYSYDPNSGTSGVAGVFLSSGSATFVRSAITGNLAPGSNGIGGIFAQQGAELVLEECEVSGNSANQFGAMLVMYSDVTILGSTISDATLPAGNATALLALGSELTVEGSTFSGNDFAINSGDHLGGVIRNSTFSGNVVGAVVGPPADGYGPIAISNSTFTGNEYGVYADSLSAVIKSSVITGNSLGDCEGPPQSAGQNVFALGSSCPFGPSDLDDGGQPGDVLNPTLADNGGPTLTHALAPGSVAIDLATDCSDLAAAAVSVDQRALSRPFGAACDAGAVEDHTPLAPGSPCSDGGVCASGNCVNDVCCAAASCADCQSCSVAGFEGDCHADAAMSGALCGDADDDECTDPDVCDGAGVCQSNDEADGSSCADGTCSAGACVSAAGGAAGVAGAGGSGDAGSGGDSVNAGEGGAGVAGSAGNDPGQMGSGGDTGTSTAGGATGGSADTAAAGDDGGCGCRVVGAGSTPRPPSWILAAIAVIFGAHRRFGWASLKRQ